ncbi:MULTISPECIES: glutamate--tRNA ligase [Acidiphilium]|uniref:Glutamate--tRNA ligase 1 n=1 Tax=Acidiphilium cryptum (strain JF-5) TaxID=349163 RepID=SYE1_ACICJ|nr:MULTISPECIES: glutamate--tRNA ligase [Acidiphilium]A5FZX8.1 RecName: Full=Glutamate--tRNA ligase 1; AltName: Full=Glutamyl-tRNA synthetase 1; Short=GluRS 1 [Acidiphilium cryptum JF-5]ABQ31160.1 glutamyl-tRNA synthetase [Acidiphilium cryptum JF-5]UNC13546.1 glutamate--tRNA ligase [Acidiphilium multivorum]
MTIRVRFAPSPTGMLHIGGARTALFNYLFARHHGGQFLLRVEDTDRERSTPEATKVILDALDWLDLKPDEPPVYQSTRYARHREVAEQMLAAGQAYRCYCSREELAEMRAEAERSKKPFRYDGRWRDRDPAEAPAGVDPVIRLRAPREGETVIHDLVQGEVRVKNAELDDMILLRSDGTPTYLHAVVVDDHDMGITHVIRGDDHLTNTFRQAQIYDAMGWARPNFAHIPLIHGADGAKLSKRHGAVSVLQFRDEGYLPEALCNYLLRLGWGHGDAEILPREEQVALFDLDGVGRAASRMDYAKLLHVNAVFLRAAEDERLAADVVARLERDHGFPVSTEAAGRIAMLMPGLKDRARTLAELAESALFVVREAPLPMTEKAEALLTEAARDDLAALLLDFDKTDFSKAALHEAMKAYAEREEKKLGAIAQPLRAALTGSTVSPPIDAVMEALGPIEVRKRIFSVLGE